MRTNIAVNTFALNDDLQSEAVNAAGDPLEKVLEAAESCPVSAITVEDEETGETLFPLPIGRHRHACQPAFGYATNSRRCPDIPLRLKNSRRGMRRRI